MKRRLLIVALLALVALPAYAQVECIGTDCHGLMPPLKTAKVTISSAQIKTCFSVPTTVIPAVPGFLIMPENTFAHKTAGVAYTVVGVGAVGLKWNDAGKTAINNFNAAGLLDSAAKTSWVARGAGSSVSLWTLVGGTQSSVAVIFHCAGADPAGPGNETITYWINYRLWPEDPLN